MGISLNTGSKGGKWKTTQGGKTISTHKTQETAETKGRRIAKRDGAELVTHGMDGKIRSKDSFGNDPRSNAIRLRKVIFSKKMLF